MCKYSKVIFLDIDGVLNIMSDTYYSHAWYELGSDPIEPHLMSRLEYIMERVPDSVIVISSSWYEEQLVKKLTKARFKYLDRIVDRTPRDVQPRGNQIHAWLEDNVIDNFIVIEDEVSDICGEKYDIIPVENVIEVDSNEGLSHINTIQSIIILNGLKQFDGIVHEFSEESYKFYYDKGYRAQISIPMKDGVIDFVKLCEERDTITINNKSLHMVLTKENT